MTRPLGYEGQNASIHAKSSEDSSTLQHCCKEDVGLLFAFIFV